LRDWTLSQHLQSKSVSKEREVRAIRLRVIEIVSIITSPPQSLRVEGLKTSSLSQDPVLLWWRP
jgi:hypothetical protein